jgi:hypothetical protein
MIAARDIETAVKLEIGVELAKHAVSGQQVDTYLALFRATKWP